MTSDLVVAGATVKLRIQKGSRFSNRMRFVVHCSDIICPTKDPTNRITNSLLLSVVVVLLLFFVVVVVAVVVVVVGVFCCCLVVVCCCPLQRHHLSS